MNGSQRQPLIVGRAAARARRVAKRFGTALLERPRRAGYDLGGGEAGLAIVHARLEQAFPGLGHAGLAERALARAFHALRREKTGPSLAGGFTGVAWAAELLGCGEPDDDDGVSSVLEQLVTGDAWSEGYDLLAGLSGVAVYALGRLPRASARRLLERVVVALERSSVRLPDGIAWRRDTRAVAGRAHMEWDLGVAHGAPGVISVLGRVCASQADVATRKRARVLATGAVGWLLAQELPRGSGGCFPGAIGRAPTPRPARSAWCYGDPGVAAALMVAGRCAGESVWVDEATRIALVAAARTESESGVVDASLCHGAAGLGHVYHRLYRATGDERLARAAAAWLDRAVSMYDPNARFGWTHCDERRVSRPGLLMGGGGVALALLAATGDADATWDQALGISAPERTRH